MNDSTLYDQLIANNPSVERKGKTTPYTSINGHMFSFLAKNGDMGLRLSADDRSTFMETYQTELMEQHGRTMKEYVHVPKALFTKSEELSEYLQKSFDYVSQLKPKPSKNKK